MEAVAAGMAAALGVSGISVPAGPHDTWIQAVAKDLRAHAGACVVQLYSALVYGGPGLVQRIKTDLAARLRAEGFASVTDAVGAG